MRFLFFSPYNGIWQHALPESIVASTLIKAGHEVNYLSCNKILNKYCVTMSAHGLMEHASSAEKNKICNICTKNTKILAKKSATKLNYIEEYINEGILNEINKSLNTLDAERLNGEKLLNNELRCFATYTLILVHKIIDVESALKDDAFYCAYKEEYKQVLIVYHAISNYFKTNNLTGIFTYNSFYPTNRTAAWVADKMNIPVYWLHAGGSLHNRLKTLNIGKGHHYNILHSWINHWQNNYKNRPASPTGIKHVSQHFNALLQGKNVFVYSGVNFKKEGLYNYFKIPIKNKIILAVLSSQDERVAVEYINVLKPLNNLCFKDQLEWIQNLITYAKNNRELTLIIRVHPRDFPNRRESVLSQQAISFKNLFLDIPENVRINWPKDNVSLYQLALITDLCVHAGSSVGKEFSILGIPSLNYLSNGLSYPHNLSFFASTKNEYFDALRHALTIPWSFETSLNAFRWCSIEFYSALWHLDQNFDELNENHNLSLIKRLINKANPFILKKVSTFKSRPLREIKLLTELIQSNVISRLDLNNHTPHTKDDFVTEKKAIFESLEFLITKMSLLTTNMDDLKLKRKFESAKKTLFKDEMKHEYV